MNARTCAQPEGDDEICLGDFKLDENVVCIRQ